MLILGIDAGSSFVKASLLDACTGNVISAASSPVQEMAITSPRPGWAEQDPEMWWKNVCAAVRKCTGNHSSLRKSIRAIGISYQMHGLVTIGKDHNVLRPAIIWCDSRAVKYGEEAFNRLGQDYCLDHLLNSPGNFTAAKLAWMKENELSLYNKIYRIMLPGDYLVLKLTGEVGTTITGLSEGIFWDFRENGLSNRLLDHFGFDNCIIPSVADVFGIQGELCGRAAEEVGLPEGIPVSYRAGDQPNNAFSLNVVRPGELAATAGTSGVLYGITNRALTDSGSRINMFAHVNHSDEQTRLGALACINGTGIMNSWIRKICAGRVSYQVMDEIAAGINPGSDGLMVYPFGNGTERLLGNLNPGALIRNLDLNRHGKHHLFRAVQEGVAYAFRYAADILTECGIEIKIIKSGDSNMFHSPLFCKLIATLAGVPVVLYNTDGAAGAARGAGLGAGIFPDIDHAFGGLKQVDEYIPDEQNVNMYEEFYDAWRENLYAEINTLIKQKDNV